MAALNIPIQLFGACSTLGDMTPLWFRYENEEHGIITVKIEEVVSSREEKYCGMDYISFICWAAAEGPRKLIEIPGIHPQVVIFPDPDIGTGRVREYTSFKRRKG